MTESGISTAPEQVEPSIRMPLTTTSGFSFCFDSSHGVPLNANPLMLVTEVGIVIVLRLLQYSKALPPILVTEFGIVIDVRLVQKLNASELMLVTESGIVIAEMLVQDLKAL